ncbi:MAG: MGMT family protein [Kofleriaceae bacterium]|nr:MGMT family protein [Kofleriaceae bacterium]MBP9167206.1 MGMT family protein [Kofleriaceae bacterium]MBP9861137.1 MGMT family protein [Kofleriaceae bacterium]
MPSRGRRPTPTKTPTPTPTAAVLTAHGQAVRAAIHTVARTIPRGRVATYGQLAELAGFPGGARVAGAAMKTSTPADRLPWHRVVGKRGGLGVIAIHDPIGAAVQRGLLEDEGVAVDDRGTIALARFGWLPTGSGRAPRARRRAT